MFKRNAPRLLLAASCLAVLLTAAVPAGAAVAAAGDVSVAAPPALVSRGESLNVAFTALTGEAVNPLFGVAAIGLYNYLKADPDARPLLPLHDQPFIWVPLLVIIALMLFNSTLCEAMPWLKIPLNALGDLVNKGGAVAVLPLVVKMFADAVAQPMQDYIAHAADLVFPAAYAADFAASSGGGLGVGASLGWLAGAVVGTAIYLAVWMSANVVDVLIMICPFPGLDALLKSLRLAVVGALLAAPAVSPALGTALAAAVVLVSALLAGWSLRLSVFGLVYSTDILLFQKENFSPAGAFAFSSSALKRSHALPMRTLGRLEAGPDGALRFNYRPWMLGGVRTVELGPAGAFAAGRGILNPFLVASATGNADEILLRFSPRFRGREEELRRAFVLAGVVDCGLSGNLRHWLESVVAGKPAAA